MILLCMLMVLFIGALAARPAFNGFPTNNKSLLAAGIREEFATWILTNQGEGTGGPWRSSFRTISRTCLGGRLPRPALKLATHQT
jgi:hypothetical protein